MFSCQNEIGWVEKCISMLSLLRLRKLNIK